jgi:hypothetical protein
MKINLHIERLIMNDIGVQPQQTSQLKAAVAAAMSQQLAAQGLGFTTQSTIHRRSAKAGSIAIENNQGVESLGHQIGHAVYGSIRHE